MEEIESNLIVWNDKFSIGIPLIDAEHKTLVSLCNNLYKVVVNTSKLGDEKRKEAVRIALKECIDYSKSHFKHEEELMELCKYDENGFKEHKAEHLSFTKKILDEIQNFDKENHVSSYEFVKFLYDWILTHIAYSDRLYVSTLMKYLKEHPDVVHNK